MAFTFFVNSTTADAADMNDNFAFVAAGTRNPLTQSASGTFTAVDATYDLGASTTTWKTAYVQNLNVSGSITTSGQAMWVLASEQTIAGTSTANIDVTGLNGDTDIEYMVFIRFNQATNSSLLRIFLGGGTAITGSAYGYQRVTGISTAVAGTRDTSEQGIIVNNETSNNTTGSIFVKCLIYAKTGNERTFLLQSMKTYGGTFVRSLNSLAGILNNTATTITSMHFGDEDGVINIEPDMNIQIWRRQ